MTARVVFTPRPNSHPFQERSILLDQPVKIGRSVARSKPGQANAIFDCKVLSRNHALLWYDSGQFYLQDTKSSNGTFVNNVRLSKSSEESPPTPINSGDILQFGVDVMELTKKVTHGCIVASLQLFTPDGLEAKSSVNSCMDKSPTTTIQDVYAIYACLRDASEREDKIEIKLGQMQKLVELTSKAVEKGWTALIDEDRLLTRIDMLERQLQASHKSMTDEKLREEVNNLLEDKLKYQQAAKEALRKVTQDKQEAMLKYQELESTIKNIEEERALLLVSSQKTNDELENLAVKFQESEKRKAELSEELGALSLKHKEETDTLNQRLVDEQELLKSRDEVIENLLNKVELHNSNSTTNAATSLLNSTEEVESLSDRLQDSEKKRAELSEELETMSLKHKEETDILNQRLEAEQKLLKSRDEVIENLLNKVDHNSSNGTPKILVGTHNNDLTLLESDGNQINESGDVSEELTSLRSKMKDIDKEKEEVISRLTNILNLFEDIRKVTNKSCNTSEYLQQLFHRMENELHSAKNCAFGLTDEHHSFSNSLPILENSTNYDVESEEIRNTTDDSNDSDLTQKLAECEEELALLKTRCNESASECSRLSQMLNQQKSQLAPMLGRSAFWIPLMVILLFAVLIVFHPIPMP